jgi:hypothetical protein
MKTRDLFILIAVIVIIIIVITTIVIPAILHRQSDRLGIILYNCAMGFERSGSLSLYVYDNGTHTIDETSCIWKKNTLP